MEPSRLLRVAASVCAICACTIFASPLRAQTATRYIFLIDTSGSMVGRPPGSSNAVIFPVVKAEVIRYLRSLRQGDIVHIRSFDEGVQSEGTFRIESEKAREGAISYVGGLRAEGHRTWVYRSILDTARAAFEEAKRLDALEIPTIFYVFTDGVDNDDQGLSMRQMLSRYVELRQAKDFLIYVTLGIDLPPEDTRALNEFPYAAHHREGRDVVRIGTVQVRARRLDFGFVEGELSAPRSLALQLNNLEPGETTLLLEPRFREVEAAGGVVEVLPSTVDMEGSEQLQIKIFNRESLPAGKFEGEIWLSTGQPHVQVIPDHVEVVFSTLPGPTATVTLPEPAGELNFGERVVGDGGLPELPTRVELNASALAEQSGFYLTVVPNGKGRLAPAATWNGEPVGDRLLTSRERFNDLVFFWPEEPAGAETFDGEVHLLAEKLALDGEGLVAGGEEGSFVVRYRLTILEPPPPFWLRGLMILAALLVVLFVFALLFWIIARKPPWVALRLWMLRTGLARPRLYGKLVYETPEGERMDFALSGNEPILLGAGTERWGVLPDQIEISPRLRKDLEVVTASRKEGDVSYRSKDSLRSEPLSGQALTHNDTLILSDEREIIFLAFEHK